MDGNRARILVVDDDPDFLEFAATILEQEGFEVELAPDNSDADWEVEEGSFDLILLDVMMDAIDTGFRFLWKIRSDDRTKSVPVIMVTAVDRELKMDFACHARKGKQTEEERAYLPVQDYIVKPVTADELISRVNAVLAEPVQEGLHRD